jgi:hypothetical protein
METRQGKNKKRDLVRKESTKRRSEKFKKKKILYNDESSRLIMRAQKTE